MKTHTVVNYPLFALGFRVFFALAGLFALFAIVIWSAFFKGAITQETYFTHNYWHAHEMLMGYTVAVIAGFLLTAVKNWTGLATITGKPLAGLALLWLYGRVVPFYEGLLPNTIIALTDFVFLPVLAYHVSKPIIQTKQYKNLVFIGLLLLLAIGNGLIHAEVLGCQQHTAAMGIHIIMATIIVLILIIAGRIFPFFTNRGVSSTVVFKHPIMDALAIASAVIVFDLQIFGVTGTVFAVAALCAAVSNLVRVYSWYVQKIWYVPLLWVLYMGYGWLILGFGLMALATYAIVMPSLALHAFTIGGIGVLTIGMMARVSLGHTGRAIRASNTIVIAFVFLNLAAFFRVILPAVFPAWADSFIYVSMLLWLEAFTLFVFVYLPILMSVRVDGQDEDQR